ncbi:helix-turn-helix transcriptional regulator [Puniceicoccaceae bacterium K14]|nr:helix-turn-helix transcriptional regulator [Puniceicoccaceae bacterium K14]
MVPRRKNKVEEPPEKCALTVCLSIIGGAWTPNIIWYLSKQPRRFSELKSDIPGISAKMLTQRLKRLEADLIVNRKVIPSSPPTVEYSLTQLGLELKPAIEAIADVGHRLKALRGEK